MRIPMKFMVDYARNKNFCISRFLVTNLESVEAVNRAAVSTDSPLLFDFYLPLMEDSCLYCVEDLAKKFVNSSHVLTGLFADHVDSVEKCLKAIDRGYSGVMIDLSAKSLEENIEGTREVVSYAHRKGVFVEGEVGIISRSEEEEIVETDPRQAEDYIKRTGVDALGVSIGVHSGFYEKEPEINYGLIRQLRDLGVHLTLHGASGLSREVIGKCIEAGMNSTGFGTDQYFKFFSKMDQIRKEKGERFIDYSKIMVPARDAMQEEIEKKIDYIGSLNKGKDMLIGYLNSTKGKNINADGIDLEALVKSITREVSKYI